MGNPCSLFPFILGSQSTFVTDNENRFSDQLVRVTETCNFELLFLPFLFHPVVFCRSGFDQIEIKKFYSGNANKSVIRSLCMLDRLLLFPFFWLRRSFHDFQTTFSWRSMKMKCILWKRKIIDDDSLNFWTRRIFYEITICHCTFTLLHPKIKQIIAPSSVVFAFLHFCWCYLACGSGIFSD